MPGIFGVIGKNANYGILLLSKISEKYSNVKSLTLHNNNVSIGGHFHDKAKTIGSEGSYYYVVDGEYGIYKHLNSGQGHRSRHLFEINNEEVTILSGCKGNILLYDDNSLTMYILRASSSCFPVYFTRYNNSFIVSSYLQPLAEITGAEVDLVGMAEYMLSGYCIGSRTQFKKVFKLCPGQIASYSLKNDEFILKDTSRLWSGTHNGDKFEVVVNDLANYLKDYWHKTFDQGNERSLGVMLSAGWDSRLVLASILASQSNINIFGVTYENSIRKSREVSIVEKMSETLCLKLTTEKALLDPSNIDFLFEVFRETETCCFPEWFSISNIFKRSGIETITCGILGEVLGGHYGQGFIGNVFQKGSHLLSSYINPKEEGLTVEQVIDLLVKKHAVIPWYIKSDSSLRDKSILEKIENDIKSVTERYSRRGISGGDKILEAFVTEHRGMHHIAEQFQAARSKVDIILPFADSALLEKVTSLPIQFRIHNKLTKALIGKLSPEMLSFPTAAILVPAKYPILIQEISRVLRILTDSFFNKLYIRSKGKIRRRLVPYRDCEYLRQSNSLIMTLDYLSLECVDKEKFRKRIEEMINFRESTPSWFFFWQLMKLLTLDFMYHKST